MKTAELQHRALPNQSAALQKGGAAMASSQSGKLTQLEALINSSAAMLTQRKLIDTIANSPFSRAKSGAPLQAKMVNTDKPQLIDESEGGGTYDLKVAGGGKGGKLSYPYLEYGYTHAGGEVATKHAAMSEMQTALADIGTTATHGKMSNSVSKATKKTPQGRVEWSSPDGSGYYTQDADQYWPFAVALDYSYKHKSNRDKSSGDVAISVFYAPGKYGYITEVMSNDDAYDIDINEPVERLQLHVPEHDDYGTYKSEHSVDGQRDLTQDGIHMEDGDGADAWTKIVAEGARWNAVKILTEHSLLTNTSKFYTVVNDEGRAFQSGDEINPPYIQFQDLWTKWREWHNAWDITDGALAEKLNTGLADSHSDIDVETLESDTHNLGVA